MMFKLVAHIFSFYDWGDEDQLYDFKFYIFFRRLVRESPAGSDISSYLKWEWANYSQYPDWVICTNCLSHEILLSAANLSDNKFR